jgi:hypothetical protein
MPAAPATNLPVDLTAETHLRLERAAALSGLSVVDFAAAVIARWVTVTSPEANGSENGAAQNSETPPAA